MQAIETKIIPATNNKPAQASEPQAASVGHTPGPWKYFINYMCPGKLKGCYVDAPVVGRVAEVLSQGGVMSQDVCEANARLIAAAPETKAQRDALLAACEAAVSMFNQSMFIWGRDDDKKVCHMTKKLFVAIQQAIGEVSK